MYMYIYIYIYIYINKTKLQLNKHGDPLRPTFLSITTSKNRSLVNTICIYIYIYIYLVITEIFNSSILHFWLIMSHVLK